MKKYYNNQIGVTLIELLVYLGISSVVVLVMTTFMVNFTQARVQTSSQQVAQHNARQVLEKMTYYLRHAYEVDVNAENTTVDIYSYNYDDPDNPISETTTFTFINQQLFYSHNGSDPVVLTDDDIKVDQVSFEKISSSVRVNLLMSKGSQRSTLNSTISFRQL